MATHNMEVALEPQDRPRKGLSASHRVATQFAAARDAQQRWSGSPLTTRLRVIRAIRHQIAQRSDQLVSSVTSPHRNGPAETLAAELLPLADACRFLEREAARILAPRRLSKRSRPFWFRGVGVELRREPYGVVLIVGASNYPLFLPGVQTLQALAAGNAVFIKPAVGSTAAAKALTDTFQIAGLDRALVQLLPEDPQSVELAVVAGIHKVVLTGSAETGRRVQRLLADSLTPSTMELSGCDAVVVLDSADCDRVVRCLAFGLRFNSSATCIAPRRVFVPRTLLPELENKLEHALSAEAGNDAIPLTDTALELVQDAVRGGARMITGRTMPQDGVPQFVAPAVLSDTRPGMQLLQADLMAPVLSLVPVGSADEALEANRACPYALGAAVFGTARQAVQVAQRVDAGCVVVNDIIAPTADPRVSFGGRRQSGFGVTRGAAGLEEMTQLKSIVHQRSNWLPHLDTPTPHDAQLLSGSLAMVHGGDWRSRLRGLRSVVRAARDQRNWQPRDT